MDKKLVIRLAISVAMLAFLYYLGLPLYFVLFFGAFIIIMLVLRGHIYRSVERYLRHLFPALSKLNPKVEKTIIVAVFIIAYILLKQGILIILKHFGVDVQQIMFESINNSISSSP